MFADGNLTRNCLHHFLHEPDSSGLSYAQRQAKEREEYLAKIEQRQDAILLKEFESTPFLCLHEPRCPPDSCTSNAEARKAAEEKCRKTLAEIALFPEDRLEAPKIQKEKRQQHSAASKGPSLATAKRAAASLSQPTPAPSDVVNATTSKAPATKPKAARLPNPSTSLLKSRKKTPPPTNPSPMRATAAAVASRQTIGYAKGRSTSSNLKSAFNAPPRKPATAPLQTRALKKRGPSTPAPTSEVKNQGELLSPTEYVAKYGLPEFGTEMWFRCRALGFFDEVKEEEGEDGDGKESEREVVDLFREEAAREFVLVLEELELEDGERGEEKDGKKEGV